MKISRQLGCVLVAGMLAGCGAMSPSRWLGSGPEEQRPARLAGATPYACADNKQFALRTGGPNAVMVILPEREFRLDAVAGTAGRYSNGRTTLNTDGETASLEESGAATFSNCKRSAAGG